LKLYEKLNDIPKMIHTFERMKMEGIKLTRVPFNSIISCFGKRGEMDKMLEWFQKLLDHNIRPDEATFGAIIHAFARQPSTPDMLKWYEKMKEFDVKPNRAIYSVMLRTFKKYRNYKGIEWCLNAMRQQALSLESIESSSQVADESSSQ
jgi:pentatricopeptide repeat protein